MAMVVGCQCTAVRQSRCAAASDGWCPMPTLGRARDGPGMVGVYAARQRAYAACSSTTCTVAILCTFFGASASEGVERKLERSDSEKGAAHAHQFRRCPRTERRLHQVSQTLTTEAAWQQQL